MRTLRHLRTNVLILAAALFPAWSQAGSGSVGGRVTDPSGRGVPDASVSLTSERGVLRSVRSDVQGQYQLRNMDPGRYAIRISAKGFAPIERTGYEIIAGPLQALDFPLELASTSEKVTVQDTLRVEVDPSNNASALVHARQRTGSPVGRPRRSGGGSVSFGRSGRWSEWRPDLH